MRLHYRHRGLIIFFNRDITSPKSVHKVEFQSTVYRPRCYLTTVLPILQSVTNFTVYFTPVILI